MCLSETSGQCVLNDMHDVTGQDYEQEYRTTLFNVYGNFACKILFGKFQMIGMNNLKLGMHKHW